MQIRLKLLHIKVRTEPCTRFAKLRIPILYVGGRHFLISAKAENCDKTPFPGGDIIFTVTFALGNLKIQIPGTIGRVDAGKETEIVFTHGTKFGVLSQGHALFWAIVVDSSKKIRWLCDEDSKPLAIQEFGFHVHTFHSLTMGELYSLIALAVTSTVFITNTFLTYLTNKSDIDSFYNSFISNIPFTLIIMSVLTVLFVAYSAYAVKPER